MPPIQDFLDYIDQWNELDRAYYQIPSWRIFKQFSNMRKREKLTKAWAKRLREAGVAI